MRVSATSSQKASHGMVLRILAVLIWPLSQTTPAYPAGNGNSTNGKDNEKGQIQLSIFTGKSGQKVFLASDLSRWDAESMPMNEVSAGTYQIRFQSPFLPYLSYKFVVDGNWITDPNSKEFEPDGFGGKNSVLHLDQSFHDKRLDMNSKNPKSFETRLEVYTSGGTREVTVVGFQDFTNLKWGSTSNFAGTSVKHFANADLPTHVIYFNDGDDYLNQTGIRNLLASLQRSYSKSRVIGVFVPPVDRMNEYAIDKGLVAYGDFLAKAVIPQVEDRFLGYRTDRQHRTIVGPSFGGISALAVGLSRFSEFGNVVSQSGSMWYQDQRIVEWISNAQHSDQNIFMSVGTFEGTEMAPSNRIVAKALTDRGFSVDYKEYPSTHTWYAWQNQLGNSLSRILK